MAPSASGSAYIIITPVRDEARYIAQTIESVISQSHPPVAWIVVDDGSSDNTQQIVRELTDGIPWIRLLSTGNTERQLGSAEVLAFNRGLAAVAPDMRYDFVVKLDGDVALERTYFEQVIQRMHENGRWGIASGVYVEEHNGLWSCVPMPSYHAAGASKVMRRECFEAIGGFVPRKGWDTVDEIRAGMKGWKTGHFADLEFRHLKPEGMAMGALGTHRFHGDIYYQTGGGILFLLAKVGHRMVAARPLIMGGLAMLFGYIVPCLVRKPRLVNAEEARFYRRLLNKRLTAPISRLVSLAPYRRKKGRRSSGCAESVES